MMPCTCAGQSSPSCTCFQRLYQAAGCRPAAASCPTPAHRAQLPGLRPCPAADALLWAALGLAIQSCLLGVQEPATRQPTAGSLLRLLRDWEAAEPELAGQRLLRGSKLRLMQVAEQQDSFGSGTQQWFQVELLQQSSDGGSTRPANLVKPGSLVAVWSSAVEFWDRLPFS